MSEDCLWRELVSCILGSRVRFSLISPALERMDAAGLFSSSYRLSRPDQREGDVAVALWGGDRKQDASAWLSRYPFPLLRARQISKAATFIYANGGSIRRLLSESQGVRELRRYFSANVAGIGPKQASLFVRNIGYTADVAVLDAHVLSYMNWLGLMPSPLKTVRTVRQYELLEDVFVEHSLAAGYSPDLYDLAVWVVVRVAKKEFTLCQS